MYVSRSTGYLVMRTTKRKLIRSKSKRKKNLFDLAGQIDLVKGYDYKAARELRSNTKSPIT